MEALSFEWLLAIGIVLIGLEALVFSFFLFPVGLGFLVVALTHLWIFNFDGLFSQLATVVSIGLAVTLLFRKKFIQMLGKSSSSKEEQIHKGGVGVVDGTQIKFEGTFWNSDDDLSGYSDGDKVDIVIIKNKAVLKA